MQNGASLAERIREIASRIRELRLIEGYTEAQLAEMTGVSEAEYRRYSSSLTPVLAAIWASVKPSICRSSLMRLAISLIFPSRFVLVCCMIFSSCFSGTKNSRPRDPGTA